MKIPKPGLRVGKQNISQNKEIIRRGKKKLFWKVVIKLYHKTFASYKSSLRIPWWAPKLWKNMKKNTVYSVFWGLWLGYILDNPRTNVDFYGLASEHVFSLLSYKMLASLRLLLWFFMDSPRPGILDIWPSVSMVYHLCQFPFPRQLGKKTYLIPRQDQSTAKLCVCSRDDRQVVPDGKTEPITCLVRVCSHSSSSAFCYPLRIIFLFLPIIPGSGRKSLTG